MLDGQCALNMPSGLFLCSKLLCVTVPDCCIFVLYYCIWNARPPSSLWTFHIQLRGWFNIHSTRRIVVLKHEDFWGPCCTETSLHPRECAAGPSAKGAFRESSATCRGSNVSVQHFGIWGNIVGFVVMGRGLACGNSGTTDRGLNLGQCLELEVVIRLDVGWGGGSQRMQVNN